METSNAGELHLKSNPGGKTVVDGNFMVAGNPSLSIAVISEVDLICISSAGSANIAGGNLNVDGSVNILKNPYILLSNSYSTTGSIVGWSVTHVRGNIEGTYSSIKINEAGLYLVGFSVPINAANCGWGNCIHGYIGYSGGRLMSWTETGNAHAKGTVVRPLAAGEAITMNILYGTATIDSNPFVLWAVKIA
ncbi:hypothetical protein BKA69DRAFT_1129339 [Paraphysoderma sedebokerense]|nr:hypothetical protein BKA69DRAFT_1129339 [Paraphysoderma sedebokerense]